MRAALLMSDEMQEAVAVLDGPLCSGPKPVEFFIHSFTLSRISNLLLESRDASRNIPLVLSESKAPGAITIEQEIGTKDRPWENVLQYPIVPAAQVSQYWIMTWMSPPQCWRHIPAEVTQQHVCFSCVYRLLLLLNRRQLSYLKCQPLSEVTKCIEK